MKKRVILILTVMLAFSIPFVTESGAAMVVKAAHVMSPKHSYGMALDKFAQLVSEKTKGEIKVQVYHAGQLGNERDVIEGLQLGSIEFTAVSTGPVVNFQKKFFLFDLPYLFRDNAHVYKVCDGEIGRELAELLLPKGIRVLAFMENGWFNITNSKRPLHNIKNLKGLKIRAMENACELDTLIAFGANPSPMAWSEVYSALQQGVMDGQQNTINAIWDAKFYEVQKYMMRTNHLYNPEPFLMSEMFYKKLSPAQKKIIQAAALEAAQYQRKIQNGRTDGALKNIIKSGMDVYSLTTKDLEEFKEASKVVYEKYGDIVGWDLIKKIEQIK